MAALLWDASALAKRYAPEPGSEVVDLLFDLFAEARMVATVTGYAETYSILLRRRNRGAFSPAAFRLAVTALRREMLFSDKFDLLSIDDEAVYDGLGLMDRHNLNATDASILSLYIRYASTQTVPRRNCPIATADQRLARAAISEGFPVINPENAVPEDLQHQFSGL